ncbi:MAG TPA: AraC family transcriptional regulator [Planctomycetota bacterium]|nr:AraC family transcriptional regulator [Planctomycetota bacterium]
MIPRHVQFADPAIPTIRMTRAGYVETPLDFAMGPRQIDDFGTAFLYAGTGWVVQAGRRHELRGGELFLIFPKVTYAFAATTRRWQVYYSHFTSPGMSALLRRLGVTPRDYLNSSCDRESLRRWHDEILAQGARKDGPDASIIGARTWDILSALAAKSGRTSPLQTGPLKAALDYIDSHLTDEVPIETLARLAHLSRFHFMRRFKRETGLSPRQYQIERRMSAARKLLLDGRCAKETAAALGYDDLFYFSRLFKQKSGVPPSRYAKAGSVVE